MLEKKYDDWCKVLKLDDISFCVELGLTLLESQAFKELVEEDETDDVDKKKIWVVTEISDRLKNKFKQMIL